MVVEGAAWVRRVGCWGECEVRVRTGYLSGEPWATFRRGWGFPDSHQARQRECVEHTSCQSVPILLGRALVACVIGARVGACCATWEMASMALSVSTSAALCC